MFDYVIAMGIGYAMGGLLIWAIMSAKDEKV